MVPPGGSSPERSAASTMATPVLDRTGRFVELQLGHDGCIQSLRQLVQPDERGVADQLRDVVVDLCHESSWAWPGVAREVRDKNTPRSTYFDGPELTAVGWVTGGDGATREILSVGHAQHVTNEGNSVTAGGTDSCFEPGLHRFGHGHAAPSTQRAWMARSSHSVSRSRSAPLSMPNCGAMARSATAVAIGPPSVR